MTLNSMAALSKLKPGMRARIAAVKGSDLRPRLLEMGLTEGSEVEVLFRAPFGDPIAVHINGYTLSMRLNEAACVELEGL